MRDENKCYQCGGFGCHHCNAQLPKPASSGNSELLMGWIPVGEELPTEGQDIFWLEESEHVYYGHYMDGGFYDPESADTHAVDDWEITHWTPAPQRPAN